MLFRKFIFVCKDKIKFWDFQIYHKEIKTHSQNTNQHNYTLLHLYHNTPVLKLYQILV